MNVVVLWNALLAVFLFCATSFGCGGKALRLSESLFEIKDIESTKEGAADRVVENVEKLVAFLDKTGKGLGHEIKWARVNIALVEALTNALKHGNKWDPQKKANIIVRFTPTDIFVSVRDEGPGIKPQDLTDIATEDDNVSHVEKRDNSDNPFKKSGGGFGLMLMRGDGSAESVTPGTFKEGAKSGGELLIHYKWENLPKKTAE